MAKNNNRIVNNSVQYVLLLFLATIFMGIGYASINKEFVSISGNAKVIAQNSFHITHVEYDNDNGAMASSSLVNGYTETTLNTTITLGNAISSTITYAVTIHNTTNDYYSYSGTSYSAPNFYDNLNITYEVLGINIGDSIAPDTSKTFYITFKYAGSDTSNPVLNSYISFDFDKYYTITYQNINTSGHNYPTTILESETTKTITFSGDVPYDVNITPTVSYTYSNGVLTLNNVNANITIDRYYGITYILDGGTNPSNQPTKYLHGTSVTIQDATKGSSTFDGWYDNSSFTGNVVTNTSGRTGDLTLYAKWQSLSFQVGDTVLITTESKNTSSSWLTSTNGYDSTTGNYKITDTTYINNSGTFTKENLGWKVWKVEPNKLTLISSTPTTTSLKFNYAKSYNNALFFMNDVSSMLYGGNIDGVTARSITMVDILEKIFEYKKTITYNGTTVNLVDSDGKAITSIITNNSTDLENVIRGLFNTSYGTAFTAASGMKYLPQSIYDYLGLSGTPAVTFSNTPAIRDFENVMISSPITTAVHSTGNFKPNQWTYSITSFEGLIDDTSYSLLQSGDSYWIASRDYGFDKVSNKAPIKFNVKQWNNNQVVPVTIYVSNTTTGQTEMTAKVRPMIELDLTKVKLNSDGTISSITN